MDKIQSAHQITFLVICLPTEQRIKKLINVTLPIFTSRLNITN